MALWLVVDSICDMYRYFSLYVSSLVEKLRGVGFGVECRGQMVTVLLYADDAVC